ncbi:hypothetical protein SLEP1_g2509 [Rubroshorea leprosula]|uniref:Uncharacterized protein n=1 Tax=Rubroshorea leprosula TaxID=152421 RepID=A0AAV5HQQ2_9ROSI|nr:hypothetical protein SLEP1_g2509 [Rubroshorea leprosula]
MGERLIFGINSYFAFYSQGPESFYSFGSSHLKASFEEVIVFILDRGNYVGNGSLQELVQYQWPLKHVMCRMTEQSIGLVKRFSSFHNWCKNFGMSYASWGFLNETLSSGYSLQMGEVNCILLNCSYLVVFIWWLEGKIFHNDIQLLPGDSSSMLAHGHVEDLSWVMPIESLEVMCWTQEETLNFQIIALMQKFNESFGKTQISGKKLDFLTLLTIVVRTELPAISSQMTTAVPHGKMVDRGRTAKLKSVPMQLFSTFPNETYVEYLKLDVAHGNWFMDFEEPKAAQIGQSVYKATVGDLTTTTMEQNKAKGEHLEQLEVLFPDPGNHF